MSGAWTEGRSMGGWMDEMRELASPYAWMDLGRGEETTQAGGQQSAEAGE